MQGMRVRMCVFGCWGVSFFSFSLFTFFFRPAARVVGFLFFFFYREYCFYFNHLSIDSNL